MTADQETSAGSGGPSRPLVASRYALEGVLKTGNGVETFLAQDVETGVRVVVKSIDPAQMAPAPRMRFEHETHVLRMLSGAGLPGLHDAGHTDDGRLYLVQPFIEGRTLEEVLATRELSVREALHIAAEVAAALDVAHAAGICHRDVKPANVMVTGDPVASVTLIDFGFARSLTLDESIRDDLVGTVRYLAPESAGLLASPADERSDLYALGVVLFECLTGRPPFTSGNVGELLRQHLSAPVPSVHVPGIQVPRAAEAIVHRLLRKEPGERYQSAAALVADLSALLTALDAGEHDPRLVIGRLDQRRTLADPAFVGRDAELEVLRELVTSLPVGGGQLVLLDAESGGGKSRLLSEAVQQAHRSGVAVLQGQGVAQAGQRPFSLLQDVAAGLVTLLESDEAARQHVVAAVGDMAPAVVRALPALAPVLGPAEEDTGPEQFGEQRSLTALQTLLSSIASPQRPILLVLDDCQWADGLTVRLLASCAASGTCAHLVIVAAFRSEEVSRSHPLRLIPQARQLHLGPLSVEAMAMLAESMAGPLPPPVLQTVTRLADGSPFMGAAVLRGLVEAGALVGTDQGWVVDEDALKDARAARRSAAFLVKRLELLSDDALELLSVGAVLGKEFDVATAVALRGISTSAEEILDEARRRRLLWVEEGSTHCTFFHDKIREALLARLDPEARRALHSLAADHLAGAGTASVFDLAYHYDAAARHDAALDHALAAAELARTQHDLDTSVLHYRIAERAALALAADGAEHATAGARERITEGLGDVLTLQGAYADAERYLVEARGLASDPVRTAALEGKLGDVAFKQGDVPTARERLESAMRHLGRRIPRGGAALVVLLLWELAVQATHTLAPRLTTGRRSGERDERDVLAMRFYSRLTYVYWFGSGKVACGWAHLRGMNLAERYPPSAELGQAYSEHAPVVTMLPWFGRGVRYAKRSLEIRRALGDVWGQGQSLSFAGVVHYAASEFGQTLDACGQAVRLLERTGDQWETNTARWNIALSHYRRGDLARAREVAHDVFLKAEAIGDRASAGIALSVCARACDGALDRELLDTQLSRGSDDVHTSTELLLAAALERRADDDLEGAAAHLGTAIRAVRRAGLRQEYVAPVHPWYATVLRELAATTSPYDPQLRARRTREAAAAARTARRWARSYRNNAPHALRESALVASMQGRARRAEKLLSRSLDVALEQGARYEAALTRAAAAELALSSGGSTASRDAAALEARAMLAVAPGDALAGPEPEAAVSLFDRFTTLLKVGRAITAATSHAALESGIRDAALQLLRGERCHLVSVRALLDDSLTTQSGESVDELSRTLLRRAIEHGVPVVGGDPGTTESESLLLSRIRSVLAAPITANGVALGCFYVTHSQIGELFGEEEEQLAAFIATLAGAAYEHLEGSEARFRSLAQNSSDVITLVGRDGVVSYQSEAATRVFALPPPGLVGRPVTSWVHDSDLELFAAALGRALEGRETRVECRFRHADGSYRWAETALTNMLDEPTVSALVLNTRDVTERRRLEDELRERALRDALTGLPNRALFLDRARSALERMRQSHAPLVVAFLDLDDFKAVNDSFGHTVGDDLLCVMAERLVRSVRPSDTVARLGGDEFAILLEDTDVETAVAIVDRLLEATGRPVPLAGTDVVAHTSIGLTSAAGPETEAEQLLAQADAAMYAAKERGKHCYELFQPEMQEAMQTRSRMRTELDHALSRDELRLRYQPIVDLSTGERIGVEALVRWAHPERGLLGPSHFIDFAEETGQIVEIGAWVLRTACRDAARLAPSTRMSVNVSARQLRHPSIVRVVREALASSGIAPQRLVLEITETATVTATEVETIATIGKLGELRRLGVQIALDDFGTGYSPLSYLRRFPVDILKVDQSFVANIAHSQEDEAIVRGVLDMARALGLATVAEGVENSEQLRVLSSLGCDRGQGYLWMRPAPLDDVVAWLGVPAPRAGSARRPASEPAPQSEVTTD